jgi:hypothetical protein
MVRTDAERLAGEDRPPLTGWLPGVESPAPSRFRGDAHRSRLVPNRRLREEPMNAFIVELTNKPGELARLTDAIAQKGANITSFAGATAAGSGAVVLVTNDEAGTRRAIADAGFRVREVELVTAQLQHVPGSLAAAAKRLGDAGVNIEAALPTGMTGDRVSVAFATDQPARAREILGASEPAGISVG